MSLGGGDLQVILRRIRHGFIICDDTELCDKIISQDVESEQRRRNIAKSKSIDVEKNDLLALLRSEPDFVLDELSHSPEWTATNVHVRRVRCETLGRLDEIKTENEAKRKVQVISWQDPSTAQRNKNANELNHSENDNDDSQSLFKRRDGPILPLTQPSPLTALIKSSVHKQNPFADYAKFDGTPNISSNQSKHFSVQFQSQKQKLQVVVCSSATITETIGFTCYKYTTENREPVLTQKDPSKYLLYIADDYGGVEEDFPPLVHERPIGQFEFPQFILIEQTAISRPSTILSNPGFRNNVDDDSPRDDPYGDYSDDDDVSIADSSRSITPPAIERRKSSSSNDKASSDKTSQHISTEIDPINNLNRLYESLNQKSYQFDYYIKQGSSKHTKIRIDVSGEQIRFESLDMSSKIPYLSFCLTTQRLIDCNISVKDKNKKKDRTRVFLIFESQQESDGSHTYQTYELESTVEIAEQFRDQILNIIKLKNQQGRDTYEQHQQQRENTKQRRTFLKIFGASISGSG